MSDVPVPRNRLLASRALAIVLVLLAVAIVVFGVRLVRARMAQSRTVAADSRLAAQCPDVATDILAGASRTSVTGADGRVLGAAYVGPAGAATGVVLRQGASQTLCDWLPWARDLSRATGARVLLFDRRGRGSSPGDASVTQEPADTAAAVARLRADGTARVALVGSSMGNAVVYAALPGIRPAPCAVVSVSPVLSATDGTGTVDSSQPAGLIANTWLTWESGTSGIVTEVDAVKKALADAGLPTPHELPVDTRDHSLGLVTRHPEVADFIRKAVASCA
ncbi:MAG: alpha/beta hydrolase [Dermatophilaceae bacterium]